MNQNSDVVLIESAERLFADLSANSFRSALKLGDPIPISDIWQRIEEFGISSLLVPEQAGGFGGTWSTAEKVIRRVGYHALPIPVGETMLVCGLLSRAGVQPPSGPLSIGISTDGHLRTGSHTAPTRLTGEIPHVPWGRWAQCVLIELAAVGEPRRHVIVDKSEMCLLKQGSNIAGEPRDSLILSDARATVVQLESERLLNLGAFIRVAQIAGALECALALSAQHVNERFQFGRPLAQFQAIQQQLALLAEETSACGCAAMAAAAAIDYGECTFEIAAAKSRANLAIARGVPVAHQCHGAIGMTMEHALQRSTRRLWSWRAEFGNDHYWAQWLGEYARRRGDQSLWSLLTERSDRLSSN